MVGPHLGNTTFDEPIQGTVTVEEFDVEGGDRHYDGDTESTRMHYDL